LPGITNARQIGKCTKRLTREKQKKEKGTDLIKMALRKMAKNNQMYQIFKKLINSTEKANS